jgi:hypothetical protein
MPAATATPALRALAAALRAEFAAKSAARGRPDEPTRLAAQAVERARIVVALERPCRECKAPAGSACVTASGAVCRQPHAVRSHDSGADMTPADATL